MDHSDRFTGAPTEAQPSPADGSPNQAQTGPVAAGQLAEDFAELRRQALRFLSAQADAARLRLRRLVLMAVLGLLALLAGTAWVVMCVATVVVGLAGVVGELFAGRIWLGFLVTGTGLSALTALVIFLMVRAYNERSRRRIIGKYAPETSIDGSSERAAGRSPLGE